MIQVVATCASNVRTLATQMQSRSLKDAKDDGNGNEDVEEGRGELWMGTRVRSWLSELCQASATQANERT